MGPACHRGDEGPVGAREQDDERLDKVRAGRGRGADGEFLGGQRAGGGDLPQAGLFQVNLNLFKSLMI